VQDYAERKKMSLFLSNLTEHLEVFGTLGVLDQPVRDAADVMTAALLAGGKVMFCGNGGSAADCQHLAAEMTGRFIKDRVPLAAISLSTDTSALTCIGNDYSFDEVFARQVRGLGRMGDCLVGISTSGNSGNVRRAFEDARQIGVTTIGLLGRDGGEILALSDYAIVVRNDVTARIQEAHIMIGHTLCGMIEQQLGLVDS
jgi:D-sedoheptulose 7-phosphate isomerase